MKRSLVLVVAALIAGLVSGCSGRNDDALMEAARAVFHQRFAAKDFRTIVENSFDAQRQPFTAEGAKWWERTWRDYGSFVRDTRDLGTSGFQGSSQLGTTIERWYNTEYSGTKMPIVESFHWLILDGTIRLRGFEVHPNSEVQCGSRFSLSGEFFVVRSCDHVQLGPVPATPPV